jgi:hypothetical protein
MAHNSVVKISKASFQAGTAPIRSNKNGRAVPGADYMPGGYIVGNEGIDATFTVQPGWKIVTESGVNDAGYPFLRVQTVRI